MRNLSLRQLQAVAAIARLSTLTRAAQELNVTPAALTSRLKQLEDEVGLLLFDRTSAGLKPTDAGRAVLSAADAIAVTLDACADRLQAIKGLAGGRVSVGVISTAKYFAPRAMAVFSRAHPSIEVRLTVGNRGTTIDTVRDYGVDLAIMGRPPRDFPVEAEVFGAHPFVMIAPPDHRLVGRARLGRADLAEEPFLVREDGSGTRIVFEEFMTGIVVRRPQLAIEVGSNETIKQAVMAGLGLALISAHTVATEVEMNRLAILDVEGLPVMRQWFLVRRAERMLGPAAAAFWEFLTREGARCLPALPMPGASVDAAP